MSMIIKALAAVAVGGALTLASAAPVDLNSLTRNGNASMTGPVLRLTDAASSQRGSAFIASPMSLSAATSFSTSFELWMHNNTSGADGMAFVVQNSPAGVNALGTTGGGLGYEGITNSVAVEFDTWYNSGYGDPAADHIGIDAGGSMTSLSTDVPAGVQFKSDATAAVHLFGWVDYDAPTHTLDVYVSNSSTKPTLPQLSETIDLLAALGGGQAYFGFSAGTGSIVNNHDIINWDLTLQTAQVVPAVGTAGKAALALLMALGSAFFYRRRKEGSIA